MDSLFEKIKNHKPGVIGDENRFKSAVCIPLIETDQGYEILLEVRSGKIIHQPGDICLPGGAIEPGETPEEAAVRETYEELCISPDQVELIGAIDIFRAGNVIIYPYVALLKDYRDSYSPDEVAEVFRLPLSFIESTVPDAYTISYQPVFRDDFPFDRIVGGRNYHWRRVEQETLFYQYKKYTIWGFTAQVLRAFSAMLKDERVQDDR